MVLAFSVSLVPGIVVVPIIEEAAAAKDRNKGEQGEIRSQGKRNGRTRRRQPRPWFLGSGINT